MSHTHNLNWKEAFTLEELPDSQIKLSGELPYAELQSERNAALVALGKNVELDGFRKGHVPSAVLEKHIGEMNILSEMAERAIAHVYPHILQAYEIDAIGHPSIEVTKIAPDNPLAFTATVAVVPQFDLPDYESIAKEINLSLPSDEVTDQELDEKIKEIQKSKRAYDRMQEISQAQADSADKDEEGEEKNQVKAEGKEGALGQESLEDVQKKVDADNDAPLPELTDEYVKTLGQPGQFDTVDAFKTGLREHLEMEKKQQVAAKHRADITDGIIAKADITLPQILVDSEINQMFAQMEDDLKRSELKMDDYLQHIKKTKEDLVAEWKPAAETRAKLQLVLNEIAKDKEIKPDEKEVATQTAQLQERFKDADEHRVRLYVASMLLNEAVMKHLETV